MFDQVNSAIKVNLALCGSTQYLHITWVYILSLWVRFYKFFLTNVFVFQRRTKTIRHKGATKWLLLANSIQECDQVFQGMSKVPICIEYLKARWNAHANHPWGRDFWSLGDWLYGTISTVGGKGVHSCCGGLCVQMGRSDTDKDKWSLSG